MIYTALTEVFFTQVKVAFFFGAFITCPIFLTQIWRFVAPGLYKSEKNAFLPFLISSPVLFLIGAAFAHYIVVPLAMAFFLGFAIKSRFVRMRPKSLEKFKTKFLPVL